jgi:hypothetical protein
MRYEKPEVVRTSIALFFVRGGKLDEFPSDSNPPPDYHTMSAYQSDE